MLNPWSLEEKWTTTFILNGSILKSNLKLLTNPWLYVISYETQLENVESLLEEIVFNLPDINIILNKYTYKDLYCRWYAITIPNII